MNAQHIENFFGETALQVVAFDNKSKFSDLGASNFAHEFGVLDKFTLSLDFVGDLRWFITDDKGNYMSLELTDVMTLTLVIGGSVKQICVPVTLDESWHNVLFTFGDGKLYLYLDGKLLKSIQASGRLGNKSNEITVSQGVQRMIVWNKFTTAKGAEVMYNGGKEREYIERKLNDSRR